MPNIFPAVLIGQDVYWDGLFSDTPPISELVWADSVGDEDLPGEIWMRSARPDISIRRKRKRSGWSDEFARSVLGQMR